MIGYNYASHLIFTLVDVDIIFVWFWSANLDSNHLIIVVVTIIN